MSLSFTEKDRLLLRRQFILGSRFIEDFPTWKKISINNSTLLTVHPDLEGAVTRTVSIMSNDPVEFETKVTISLEQTK